MAPTIRIRTAGTISLMRNFGDWKLYCNGRGSERAVVRTALDYGCTDIDCSFFFDLDGKAYLIGPEMTGR